MSPLAPHAGPSLWLVPEPCAAQAAQLPSLLSAAECERQSTFANAERRAQFVFARAALRQLLAEALDCAPAAVHIEIDGEGRPRLHPAHRSAWHFSLAHTRGQIAVALHPDAAIGVDVEQLGRPRDFVALAQRFFTPRENEFVLGAVDDADRAARFMRCWTLKEAWYKAFAGSSSLVLSDFGFAFDLLRGTIAPTTPMQLQRCATLWSALIGEGHAVALAWHGGAARESPPLRCWQFDWQHGQHQPVTPQQPLRSA